MNDSTLKKLIKDACNLRIQNIAFEWIGGETLLAGIEFFEKSLTYQKKYNYHKVNITNAIQTNGTLVTQEWIDFFKRNSRYGLSVSYDCFEKLHNQTRITRSGKGTFNQVRENLHRLKSNNIRFGVLVTISEDAIELPADKWVECFVNQQLFHIGLQLDYYKYSDKEFIKRYFVFIQDLFAAQEKYNQSVSNPEDKLLIRESYYLANYIKNLDKKRFSCQHTSRVCTSYLLSIGVNGDIYACCDAFMGMASKEYENFLCGNINNNDFDRIFKSETFSNVFHDIESGKKKCSSCNYFKFCNGGCGLFKLIETGSIVPGTADAVENYCNIQKKYFSFILDIEKREMLKNIYDYI